MFGEEIGYMSSNTDELSEGMKAKIDHKVKEILQESENRVKDLLLKKGGEIRELSRNLYWYDYLTAEEMDKIFKGEKLEKDKVRDDSGKQENDYSWEGKGKKGDFVSF